MLAAALEGTIDRELIFLLFWAPPTNSAYTMAEERIPSRFTDGFKYLVPQSLLTGYLFKRTVPEGIHFRA